MSTESNVAESASAPIGRPEELIAARERRGWSMSDVASKLGMMPRQIDAIENGRWEALPGHAFVRGAIRAYGKALRADVGPLLATLGENTHVPELRASSSLDAPMPRRGALGFDNGGSGSRLTWIVLGVLGVVAIAMYFGRGADLSRVLDAPTSGRTIDSVPVQPSGTSAAASPGASGSTPSEPAPPPSGGASAGASSGASSSAPRAADGAQALLPPAAGTTESGPARSPASVAGGADGRAAAAGAARTDAGPAATSGPANATSGATTPSASVTDAGPAAAAAAGGATASGDAAVGSADSLVLRFERESWVEVRDANGRRLLYGTEPAQSTREVSGRKPYSVTLGNAPFVRLEHDGRAIDLGTATRNGVARLTVE